MKPGFTTTEFWSTILAHVVALVALFHPGFNVGQWVQPLSALGAALSAAVYTHSRTSLKTALAPAVQTVVRYVDQPYTTSQSTSVTAAAPLVEPNAGSGA